MMRYLMLAIMLGCLPLAGLAAEMTTSGVQVLSPTTRAQLALSPAQSAAVDRITQNLNEALLVPIFPDSYAMSVLPAEVSPTMTPIDQVIAMRTAQLTAELNRRHPNPIAVQGLAQEIAALQQSRQLVINSGYAAVVALLTPEQRQRLPQ